MCDLQGPTSDHCHSYFRYLLLFLFLHTFVLFFCPTCMFLSSFYISSSLVLLCVHFPSIYFPLNYILCLITHSVPYITACRLCTFHCPLPSTSLLLPMSSHTPYAAAPCCVLNTRFVSPNLTSHHPFTGPYTAVASRPDGNPTFPVCGRRSKCCSRHPLP